MFKGLEPQGNDYNSLQPSVYNLNFSWIPFQPIANLSTGSNVGPPRFENSPYRGVVDDDPWRLSLGSHEHELWVVGGIISCLLGNPKFLLDGYPLICLVFIVQVSNLIVLWKTYPVPCPTYNSSLLFLKRFHLAPLDCRRVRRWSYCVPKAVAILSDDSARDTFSRESRRVR